MRGRKVSYMMMNAPLPPMSQCLPYELMVMKQAIGGQGYRLPRAIAERREEGSQPQRGVDLHPEYMVKGMHGPDEAVESKKPLQE